MMAVLKKMQVEDNRLYAIYVKEIKAFKEEEKVYKMAEVSRQAKH